MSNSKTDAKPTKISRKTKTETNTTPTTPLMDDITGLDRDDDIGKKERDQFRKEN